MSGSTDFEAKCPKCGNHQGIYDRNNRTREEWFSCQTCGWYYEITLRPFGKQSLSNLRALLGTESGQQAKPPEWSLTLDHLLAEIAEDWVKYTEPLKTLNSILNRPFAERTSRDWEFLVRLSEKDVFLAWDETVYESTTT